MRDPYRYFRVEAAEILEQLQKGLLELEKSAASAEVVARLLRHAHTLKGAARVVKQNAIAELSHTLEDVLIPLRDLNALVSVETIASALAHVDAMRAELRTLVPAAEDPLSKPPSSRPDAAFLAVRPHVRELDTLLDGILELNVQLGGIRRSRTAIERAKNLAKLVSSALAPRRVLQSELGAAAKARSLAEELESVLETAERELLTSAEQAGRELGEVRDAAERLRLVPAELMWGALERTARDAANSLGKRVNFSARGGDIRLDADLLGLVLGALVQAVRNAVAHGIELPAERSAAQKAVLGEIVIDVTRRDTDVVFACRDDGRGLDLDAVRHSAERRGLDASVVAGLDAEGLFRLLLRGGISTSSTVTEVAGRGIGLDLVRETATKLGGSVMFQSTAALGTTLSITVPVSLSALSALLVEARGQVLAIPLAAVRFSSRRLPDDITHGIDGDSIVMAGRLVPYVLLGRLLRVNDTEYVSKSQLSAVLIETAAGSVALGVDRLLGVESIVQRSLPELVLTTPVVSGACLDRDGNPRMVLSPDALVRSAQHLATAPRSVAARQTPILVIDDSLTTRMLEQSILESAGYEVELATSGEEGIAKAKQRKYALFLVDVEMPGMDGFTFIETARKDPTLRDVPSILVTSRASAADRERGLLVGARAHIAKNEFEQGHLLDSIRALVN
jgi:two-component system, chemotaxis family, sensor kinase CheA